MFLVPARFLSGGRLSFYFIFYFRENDVESFKINKRNIPNSLEISEKAQNVIHNTIGVYTIVAYSA